MEIMYGYSKFCNPNDKNSFDFLKEGNGLDILGLRKTNVKISDLLFPECSTLMPNLVYFYYLFAIYDILKERGEDIKKLNEYEEKISQGVLGCEGYSPKGFFERGTEKRAFEIYKAKLILLQFIEQKENGAFAFEELNKALRESPRYKMVQVCMKRIDQQAGTDWSKLCSMVIDSDEWKKELETPASFTKKNVYQLTNEERLDFCKRVVFRFPNICSLFAWLVLVHLNHRLKYNSSRELLNQIKTADKNGIKRKKKDAPLYGLESIFGLTLSDLCGGKENNEGLIFEDIYLYECELKQETIFITYYDQAKKYSLLQYIAKMAYNAMLFRNDEDKKKEYKEKLKKSVEQFRNSNQQEAPKKRKLTFDVIAEGDAFIQEAIDFLEEIRQRCMQNDRTVEEIANELTKYEEDNIIVKREHRSLGSGSFLDYPVLGKPIADYVDTFRWEYHPVEDETEQKQESSGKAEDGTKKEAKMSGKQREYKFRTRCVSYYIYELFYENKENKSKENQK